MILLAILGVGLVLLVLIDALWTTLWIDGAAGPVTSRVGAGLWRVSLALAGRKNPRMQSLAGPLILAATYATWILLLWAGWVFILAADPNAILTTAEPKTPPDWSGRIWFVGYTISTLGNGDFSPNGGVWQIVISFIALSGFSVTTLALSYLVSMSGAVVTKRALASQVTGMGSSAEELVRNAWNGRDFHTLDQSLTAVSTQLSGVTQRYLAYPALKYFHEANASDSLAVALAVLDDSLTLLRYGVSPEARPNVASLHSARSAVQTYLGTIHSTFAGRSEDAPPPPDLNALRAIGVPTVSDAEFADAVEQLAERRRLLLGFVLKDGWRWSDA